MAVLKAAELQLPGQRGLAFSGLQRWWALPGSASSGRQLPGMLPGWTWGWQLCYLLALTTLQLPSASKGSPAAAAKPPTPCPGPGKGTFQELYGPALLSSLHSQPPRHQVSTLSSNLGRKRGCGLEMERGKKAALILKMGFPLVLDIWLFKPYTPATDSSFCFPFTTPTLRKRFA